MASRQLIIPGGLLLGMGIGMIFGESGAGMFIGLGLGLLVSAFLAFSSKKSENDLERRVAELEKQQLDYKEEETNI
ncbi:hypothetical protein [Alkalibacillus silvisoli]|uniref:Uncharacterized protein n=1 Tax=Alkalibacillus silvisoli TaxID=392823 RepID=A0ABN1A2X6_9BACI